MKKVVVLVFIGALTLTFDPCWGVGHPGKVIFAVNAGGPRHVDVYGIEYQEDTLKQGVPSDHGKRFDIRRVPVQDQILYQTERYGLADFGYEIPIKEDGDYVIVLKFCEVYFKSPRQKVFNVVLNKELLVIPELDIFRKVGVATAHDEYIPFKVRNQGKTLWIDETDSSISGGKILIQFAKGSADNPKINALYAFKGTINDVPTLPPMVDNKPDPVEKENSYFDDEEEYEDELAFNSQSGINQEDIWRGRGKVAGSGRIAQDPWESESSLEKYAPIMGSILLASLTFGLVFLVAK